MKDPAFLFYDGDAARDVSHMNRIERGCYFDFLQAQRKFHGITVEQARKILGKDFETCWPALEMILSDVGGVYFIQWVKDSTEKRAQNSEIQRKRIQDYWDRIKNNGITTEIPRNNRGTSTVIPLENENENKEDKEGYGGNKEENSHTPEVEILYSEVLEHFDEDFRPKNDAQKKDWLDTLDKLIRIDGHTPEQIDQVIKFTRGDPFWKINFLSLLKLRQKNKEKIPYFLVFQSKMKNEYSSKQSGKREIKRINAQWGRED
jgi:hypothetical protein